MSPSWHYALIRTLCLGIESSRREITVEMIRARPRRRARRPRPILHLPVLDKGSA